MKTTLSVFFVFFSLYGFAQIKEEKIDKFDGSKIIMIRPAKNIIYPLFFINIQGKDTLYTLMLEQAITKFDYQNQTDNLVKVLEIIHPGEPTIVLGENDISGTLECEYKVFPHTVNYTMTAQLVLTPFLFESIYGKAGFRINKMGDGNTLGEKNKNVANNYKKTFDFFKKEFPQFFYEKNQKPTKEQTLNN